MAALEITAYRDYDSFAQEWQAGDSGNDDTESRLLWQLLGQLDDDELLIQIPGWLAEEKIGFVDGGTPTEFVGRIERESEKAIRFSDSAAAPELMKLAHRIHRLEDGLENAAGDDSRHDWLADRLQEKRTAFETREGAAGLTEEWLPKSQIQQAVRRIA